MKRSPMPPRRTPLKRGGRLRQVGARKARTLAAERAFRVAVRVRAGGMCEAHTPACPPGRHEGHHAHHRAPSDRDRGVHDAARGLWTCAEGHHYLHAHPAESYQRGWLLRDGSDQ